MNRTFKLAVPLLLLMLCMALSGASAQVAINAEDGTDLPDSISVGETFTVLITESGNPVGVGTNVVFTLPASGGDPIYVQTDGDGKARYKPLLIGTLGIKVLDGTVTVAEATVTVDSDITSTYYRDADGDTYGNASDSIEAESVPEGYVTDNTDCDDTNAAVNPGATEVCNGIDDDCDGQIDEGVKTTYYGDADGDGYGDPANTTEACSVPDGYVENDADCDDANAAVNPGATEICNGIDDDCDGVIDECCTNVTNVDGETNFTATSGDANVTGNFNSTLTGWVNVTGITDVTDSPDVNDSNPYYGLGDNWIISGVIVDVSNSDIESQLADGNGTIRIMICYDPATLGDIDPDTLAIWKYNSSTETWEKQLPSTIDGLCVYADVTHLCTFALVGALGSGGNGGSSSGGDGTYPPGWGDDAPASTPAATPAQTAAPEPTVASTKASTEAPTEAPPAEAETKEMETETTKLETKGTPGFGAVLTVFAIAGLLVAAYLVMRRRE